MNNRKVVITGLGAITPIGNTAKDFFRNLIDGKTGVRATTRFDVSRCQVKKSAEIIDFNPESYGILPKDQRVLDRFQLYALAAAEMAVFDAHLDFPRQDIRSTVRSQTRFTRYGAAIGVAYPGVETLEKQIKQLWQKGSSGVSPHIFNMTLPNAATSVVSIRFALGGPIVTICGASAAGTETIIAAYDKIRSGRADLMVAGGTEAGVNEIVVSGFQQNQTGSKQGICRPFDKNRDGTVLGEGAAVFILEEYEHAIQRNAKIYGEILGYGQKADAYDMTDIPPLEAPGLTNCLLEALSDARLEPTSIDYINAHATATKMNDISETNAIKNVFGEHAYQLKVSGIKGSVGHMLGAAGAVELMAALLASCFDYVPPTYGLETPDPELDLDYVPGYGIKQKVNISISTSVGMGGGNTAIIVRGNKFDFSKW